MRESSAAAEYTLAYNRAMQAALRGCMEMQLRGVKTTMLMRRHDVRHICYTIFAMSSIGSFLSETFLLMNEGKEKISIGTKFHGDLIVWFEGGATLALGFIMQYR